LLPTAWGEHNPRGIVERYFALFFPRRMLQLARQASLPAVARWGVVQLVGHLTVNEDGEGSNPSAPANSFPCKNNGIGAVRVNLFILSHESATYSSSPEISSIAFHAQPPNLRFASLIDMGLATIGPLARRSGLRSGSCTWARVFAPRFLQTPPRGDALALRYHFTAIRL
jgi:hypothetical protein